MKSPTENVETGLALGQSHSRPDRLITITGNRQEKLVAEYSTDTGESWQNGTIYIGATVDEWRASDVQAWNEAATDGRIPEGDQVCLWNYFFDANPPADKVLFRLKSATHGEVHFQQAFDLTDDTFVIDHRNVTRLAGGRLPEPWSLKRDDPKEPATPSLCGQVKSISYESEYPTSYVENAHHPPLVLKPDLEGWHRIYIGLEPVTSVRLALSGEQAFIPIPREEDERLMREYYVESVDLSGQDIWLLPGGSRVWCDALIRYIRFVPMTGEEISQVREARDLSETEGRPFAGYVEQLTAGYRQGETITLQDYTRNEMRLHKSRGCTDVYVHVIRIGFSAWYHSDVVERYIPDGKEFEEKDPAQLKWAGWMVQGDPMEVAVQEARKVGLNVFADIGMNITYLETTRFHYRAFTGQFANDHPEYACPESKSFLDYRHPPVQDYAVAIVRELMTKYDVDGVHLDFARFAHNGAFDEASLLGVGERIHKDRRAAEQQWGHPVAIGVRIPSYMYHTWEQYTGDYPEFLSALTAWARNGWIDHVMVCSMLLARLPELSLERYREAISGTEVELWGDLYGMSKDMPRSCVLDTARKWRKEGVDGGFFLYDSGRPIEFAQINRQLRLIDMPERWDALG